MDLLCAFAFTIFAHLAPWLSFERQARQDNKKASLYSAPPSAAVAVGLWRRLSSWERRCSSGGARGRSSSACLATARGDRRAGGLLVIKKLPVAPLRSGKKRKKKPAIDCNEFQHWHCLRQAHSLLSNSKLLHCSTISIFFYLLAFSMEICKTPPFCNVCAVLLNMVLL